MESWFSHKARGRGVQTSVVETLSTGLMRLTTITTGSSIVRQIQTNNELHYELAPELEEWFENQGWVMGRDWRWQWLMDPVFYFTDGNKAMLFKLAWGGQ